VYVASRAIYFDRVAAHLIVDSDQCVFVTLIPFSQLPVSQRLDEPSSMASSKNARATPSELKGDSYMRYYNSRHL
jgi:hypothetical protein